MTSNPQPGERRQEFFLPVSGFVWLHPEEVEVVNHPALQRLGRIRQLGQTNLVYRGATHMRLEHALGTIEVVERMIAAVNRNARQPGAAAPAAWQRGAVGEAEARFIRLGALLHDVGHLAAGHTLEDELGWLGRHDDLERLQLVLQREHWGGAASGSPSLSLEALVNRAFAPHLPPGLPAAITPARLALAIAAADAPPLAPVAAFRIDVARDLIGNTICADLLDYLHRDWYHIGKPRPADDRLFQYMELRHPPGRPEAAQFVLSLGSRPKLRTDAVSNMLDLLEWRYQLADVVLFHRAKLAAAAMLDRALFGLWGETLPFEWMLPLNDEQLLEAGRERARAAGIDEVAALWQALAERRLFRAVATYFHDQLPAGAPARIARQWRTPAARNRLLQGLEAETALPPLSLALYCPPPIHAKIAATRVAIDDEIAPLADYEAAHGSRLTGGHLEAQQRRFQRLWRVAFYLKREVTPPPDLSEALHRALQIVYGKE